MYMHKVVSTYGRLVKKPEDEVPQEDSHEDAVVPIQDQIENLRIKIGLKERYNRVLTEELEESRQGASNNLKILFVETRDLRYRLLIALTSETTAVQQALRSHRILQMALTRRDTHHGVPWLDDKLFDITKKLNRYLYDLTIKRRCLEEAESMVVMLEKWPRPGSLPWELIAFAKFQEVENTIEDVRIKGETQNILHSKYTEIKFILREEQGKYRPLLLSTEVQLKQNQDELKMLQKMLDDAIYFRAESLQNLGLTEKESSENRKDRRREMARCKKNVTSALQDNMKELPPPDTRPSRAVVYELAKIDNDGDDGNKIDGILKVKKDIAEEYQIRSRRLINAMRVHDITYVPARLRAVFKLGEYLTAEQSSKDHWRDTLVKQRDQLNLLYCHFLYTGEMRQEKHNKTILTYETNIDEIQHNLHIIQHRQSAYGNLTIDLLLGSLTIIQRLEDGKHRRKGSTVHLPEHDIKGYMRQIISKIKKIIKINTSYEEMFKDKESDKNYSSFVKAPVPSSRLIRVEEPVIDEDFEDDEFIDLKVPTRVEIKSKSERYIQQALLKRGLK